MSSNIFKLISLNPVGFKKPNYPTPYCSLCRGYLDKPCNNCTKVNNEKCPVYEKDNIYYHNHCYVFINGVKNNKK